MHETLQYPLRKTRFLCVLHPIPHMYAIGLAPLAHAQSAWRRMLGLERVYYGPLFALDPWQVLEYSSFSAGEYIFLFGIDLDGDGNMDYYDTVQVMVSGSAVCHPVPPNPQDRPCSNPDMLFGLN